MHECKVKQWSLDQSAIGALYPVTSLIVACQWKPYPIRARPSKHSHFLAPLSLSFRLGRPPVAFLLIKAPFSTNWAEMRTRTRATAENRCKTRCRFTTLWLRLRLWLFLLDRGHGHTGAGMTFGSQLTRRAIGFKYTLRGPQPFRFERYHLRQEQGRGYRNWGRPSVAP